ncbi:MAG: DUF4115 domain-containing protein [Alphaproteobacteria bacterium]|nr:DUF4115 domain-containing protein [Alphaproteobacteria bacterium]
MAKVTKISAKTDRQDGRRSHLREVSGDFDVPLGTVGQELRGARISRGEDVETVSRILKIRMDHLAALEDDNIAALPGRTYAVGFIRAYAEYLGLNPVDTVDRFKTEIAGRHDPSKTAGFKEPEELPGRSWGWLIMGILMIGLIAYGIYYVFASPAPAPAITPAAPPASAERTPPPGSTLHPKSAGAVPRLQSSSRMTGPVRSATAVPAPAQAQVYGKWNLHPRIVLRIKQPTHILVQDEKGTEFINKVLQPGDSYQVANQDGLSLTAEHGNAVEIDVDGKPVRMAGNSAELTTALPLNPRTLAGKPQAGEPSPNDQ